MMRDSNAKVPAVTPATLSIWLDLLEAGKMTDLRDMMQSAQKIIAPGWLAELEARDPLLLETCNPAWVSSVRGEA